jgi:hypothetical protein
MSYFSRKENRQCKRGVRTGRIYTVPGKQKARKIVLIEK